MAHEGTTRMAQLMKRWKCEWSWQLSQFSLETMRQFDERAQLEGMKFGWATRHFHDFKLAGRRAVAVLGWLLSSTGGTQPKREVGCSDKCTPVRGR